MLPHTSTFYHQRTEKRSYRSIGLLFVNGLLVHRNKEHMQTNHDNYKWRQSQKVGFTARWSALQRTHDCRFSQNCQLHIVWRKATGWIYGNVPDYKMYYCRRKFLWMYRFNSGIYKIIAVFQEIFWCLTFAYMDRVNLWNIYEGNIRLRIPHDKTAFQISLNPVKCH